MDQTTLQYFPIQKKSFKEKDEQWRKECIDGVIGITYAYGRTRRSSSRDKRRNYELFNNRINKADFDYVLNPFNLSKEQIKSFNFPASLQPYDVTSPRFNLLLGEESKRPFNPVVRAVNEDALHSKQEAKKAEILGVLEQMLVAHIDPQSIDPDNPPPAPEQLTKYQNYTPKMMIESVAEKLLTHYYRHENLDKIFNDCFKDVLLAAEEIIAVDRVGDGVKVRRVNPLEIWFQLPSNSDLIDEADKIYERTQMSVSEIVNEFYEWLTPDQIEQMELIGSGQTSMYNYGDMQFNIPEVDSIYSFDDGWSNRGIPVHRVKWASFKKQGVWHFYDENGAPQQVIVEEGFKMPKGDKNQYIEWFWVKEYWRGVRIGMDIYLWDLCGPCPQQFRSMDNLSECKSGYIGTVYSCQNSRAVSLMDRLVPWIYLYLILWYRTELAMAKNIGKIALIDTSLIPDNWEVEKWMYYAQAMGFGFVNSYNESNRSSSGGANFNQSNQNKSLDLETGAYIQQHIAMLDYVNQQIELTSGITRQRLGAINSSELVGNTERAVVQSSHITEPYFAPHEFFKKRVCEAVIEVAKECLEDNPKNFQYITDDLATVLFKVEGDFVNADYGVFLSNSTKDQQALETLKQLMQSAIQNEKINMSAVVDVLNSTSLSDIKAKLIASEQQMQEAQQGQAEQEQEMQKQMHDEALALEKEKMDRDDYNKEQDRQTNIQIAEIKTLGFEQNQDADNDGTPDVMEQGKLALEERKHEWQRYMEEKKLKLEDKKIEAENQRTKEEKALKLKELDAKERIEKFKIRHKPKPKTGKK